MKYIITESQYNKAINMKYIITESRLNNVLDKLFIKRYGSLLVKDENPDGYVVFLDSQPSHKENNPFELNVAGNLWINDYTFFKSIKDLIGFETSLGAKELIKRYFEDRYGVKVVMVSIASGYRHPDNGPDDDDDSWLEEN
jgi:hypothetical protein